MKQALKKAAPKKAKVVKLSAKKTPAKKIAATPKESDVKQVVRTVSVNHYDFSKVPNGSTFSAMYRGKLLTGILLRQEDALYMFHNTRASFSGKNWMNVNGYKFQSGIPLKFAEGDYNFKLLSLGPVPKGFIPPIPSIGGRRVEINKGSIEVGCQTISNETVRLIASRLKD